MYCTAKKRIVRVGPVQDGETDTDEPSHPAKGACRILYIGSVRADGPDKVCRARRGHRAGRRLLWRDRTMGNRPRGHSPANNPACTARSPVRRPGARILRARSPRNSEHDSQPETENVRANTAARANSLRMINSLPTNRETSGHQHGNSTPRTMMCNFNVDVFATRGLLFSHAGPKYGVEFVWILPRREQLPDELKAPDCA